MPNKINPIARYLFALSAMIVAYTLYAKIAVPFLEGPPGTLRRESDPIQTADSGDQLDKSHLPSLVPADAWELGPCKTLLTPQGTVYFEYWEPVDDEGTYTLMPFTIVMNDPVNRIHTAPHKRKDQNASPIVLRAQKGAQLKFNKPLTARSGNDKVEMESAWLEGQVTLLRPENVANKEQELRVVTSNIQINRQQVFTLDDVYFSIGPHHGSGRNLSIKLSHDSDTDSPERDFDNIKGVEQMELAYVSELVLNPASESNKTFSPNTTTQTPVIPLGSELSLSNQKTPLQLSCDGPFIFRMEEKKAWFHDRVKVTQLNGIGDNLQCDSLQIEFGKSDGKPTSVSKLIAIGSAEQPAIIDAISRQTRIVGQELNFDVPNSIVEADGSQPVTIRSPKLAFVATRLWYQLGESGRIGKLDAAGPGRLQGVSTDGKRSFQVDWAHRLTTKSIDVERIQIDIEQDAKVQFDAGNRIESDNLSFIVWEMPSADSTTEKPGWQYLPSKLTSLGNVNILSEKLEGTADEFVAIWPRPTQRQLGTVRHTVSYRRQQEPFRSPWTPVETPVSTQDSGPTKFSGQRVLANVMGDLDNMQIQNLNIDGMVSLETFPQGRDPVTITGHTMKLVPQGPELYRVTIESSDVRPATFRTNGFALKGDNLQMDQKENTVWVQGEGDLRIDTQAGGQFSQPSDEKMADLEKVDVKWSGGMVFDGSKIYFEHDVKLDAKRLPEENGEHSVISTMSEAVTIELTQPIQLEKLDSSPNDTSEQKSPEVRRMIFVSNIEKDNRAFRLASHSSGRDSFVSQNVLIENATFDASGKLVGLQKLDVPSATADAETGNVRTSGPGVAISYQYSDGKSSKRLSGFSQSNPDQKQKDGPELSCVHCRFDGQLVANSQRGTMVIDENTRSAWSVVNSFDKTIDPDRPDQLPIGAAVLKSDKLEFAQWTPRNGVPRQDMRAEGNTSIKSQLFEAVANRLSYTDETDILIIESNPPADAKLIRRSRPNAKPDTVLAQKILYRLSDQWFKVNDIRSIDANLPARKK